MDTIVSFIPVIIFNIFIGLFVYIDIKRPDIANTIKGIVIKLLAVIGYIANLFAIAHHWSLPLTMQYLAEFIGVIIFPIGIITGWLYILLGVM